MKIVDYINPYQTAKDAKTAAEAQVAEATSKLATVGPALKTALEQCKSKSAYAQTADGKLFIYALDANSPDGFSCITPDSPDTEITVPTTPETPPSTPPVAPPVTPAPAPSPTPGPTA